MFSITKYFGESLTLGMDNKYFNEILLELNPCPNLLIRTDCGRQSDSNFAKSLLLGKLLLIEFIVSSTTNFRKSNSNIYTRYIVGMYFIFVFIDNSNNNTCTHSTTYNIHNDNNK